MEKKEKIKIYALWTISIFLLLVSVGSGFAAVPEPTSFYPVNSSVTDYATGGTDNSLSNFNSAIMSYETIGSVTLINQTGNAGWPNMLRVDTDTTHTQASGEDLYTCLFAQASDSGTERLLYRETSSDKWNLARRTDDRLMAQVAGQFRTFNYYMGEDELTHICVYLDNSADELHLYINGTLNQNMTSVTDNPTFTDQHFNIGHRDFSSKYWNGYFGMIRLGFNDSLTAAEALDIYNEDSGASGGGEGGSSSSNTLVNLTGDYAAINDTGSWNLTYSTNGNAAVIQSETYCKLDGCFNFSDGSGDFFNSTIPASHQGNITISFWAYPISTPSGSNSMMNFRIGSHTYTEEGDYGLSPKILGTTGTASENYGSSQGSTADRYSHYVIVYDGSRLVNYKNGAVVTNSSEAYGNTNITQGDIFEFGRGLFGIDFIGYMDEFFISGDAWTTAEVEALYAVQKLGTPPTIDLYLDSLEYNLLDCINWSSTYNTMQDSCTLPINMTIKNAGVEDANASTIYLEVNGSNILLDTITLTAGSSQVVQYNWTAVEGTHNFTLFIDYGGATAEDVETNNNYSFFVPYIDLFDSVNFNTYEVASEAMSTSTIPGGSHNWFENFDSESWSNSYDCGNVDYRANKHRESALKCALNEWNSSNLGCQKADDFNRGWATRDLSSCTDVQELHYYQEAIASLVMMLPYYNQTDFEGLVTNYTAIASTIYNLENVRPDTDSFPQITPGNGRGFGDGLASIVFFLYGYVPSNPTMMHDSPDSYYSQYNMFQGWENRQEGFLRGRLNESFSFYWEGTGVYSDYAQERPVENIFWLKDRGYKDYSEYTNAFCAMAKEQVVALMDYRYSGSSKFGDEDHDFRRISRGDSNSYEQVGGDGTKQWSYLGYLALLCGEVDTANQLLYLWNLGDSEGDHTNSVHDIWIYNKLTNLTGNSVGNISSAANYYEDNINEIYTWRNAFTYQYDSIFQIDGGQHKMSGHPNAQGRFDYFNGYEFVAYNQVPYNDNVRDEAFVNSPGFITYAQSSQGGYIAECGEAKYYQHYGDNTCTAIGTYPNIKWLPQNESGNVTGVYGSTDARFGVAVNIIPMSGTEPITEMFVKLDDAKVRFVKATGSPENQVVDPVLQRDTEISVSSMDTENITYVAQDNSTIFYYQDLVYTNVTPTLVSSNTTIQYGYTKENTPTGKGHYRSNYLIWLADDVEFIRVDGGYLDSTANKPTLTSLSSSGDQGVSVNNANVYFDSDGDGTISAENFTTDAEILVVDVNGTGSYMVSKATYVNYDSVAIYNDVESSFIGSTSVSLISFSNFNINETAIGVNESIVISVDASSSAGSVDIVYFEIILPNGSTTNFTDVDSDSDGTFQKTFTDTSLLGTYQVSVVNATDSVGNNASSVVSGSFIVGNRPTLTSVEIKPSGIDSTQDAYYTILGTDGESTLVSYYCDWYINDVAAGSTNILSVAVNTSQSSSDFSGSYAAGDLLKAICVINDGDLNSTALSAQVTINNPPASGGGSGGGSSGGGSSGGDGGSTPGTGNPPSDPETNVTINDSFDVTPGRVNTFKIIIDREDTQRNQTFVTNRIIDRCEILMEDASVQEYFTCVIDDNRFIITSDLSESIDPLQSVYEGTIRVTSIIGETQEVPYKLNIISAVVEDQEGNFQTGKFLIIVGVIGTALFLVSRLFIKEKKVAKL